MAKQQNGFEEEKPKWVNPNKLSDREKMDKYLESQGLLKYQTEGMSAGQIAGKFAQAGVKVNENWGAQTYGGDFRNPQVPIMPGAGAGGGVKILPKGGSGDRPQNVVAMGDGSMFNLPKGNLARGDGNVQYVTAPNGMVVKVNERAQKIIQAQATNAAERAQRAQDEKFVIGATMEQVLSGDAGWTDMSSWDRKQVLEDPNFYKGDITKFSLPIQQQILNDPGFQWEKLPAWQKTYFELSSSPAGMGAVQGGLMGAIGGPVGGATGAALGAGLGALAAKSGYDTTKEFWEQDGLVAGGFGLMNWLAEQAEKTAGMGFQIANAAVDKNKRVVDVLNKESWQAGANFFEVITPAWIEAVNEGKGELGWDDLMKVAPPVYVLGRIGDLIANPEKYKGQEYYLGANSPMQLDESWIERIDGAREEIKKGKPYREVMMEMQTGVIAQLGDMAGQAIADPLNVIPDYTTKIAGKAAELGGNKVAATALNQSSGLMEAGRKYKTLVQSGQALTIDPNFKLDQMGKFSRMVAGINEQGQVKAGSLLGTTKGLLDPIKNKAGWLEDMATQTPHSRAQTGAGMFYENISAMLTMFDDPTQAGKYLKALAKNDMNTWNELGSRFAESPEFYTVLPALKDFNTSQLDGIIQAWDMTTTNRDLLTRVADIMGEQPGTLLQDLVTRGTAEQDFQRVVTKLQESQAPAAKALLAEVEAGTFTKETLAQMVDVFSGEGALPWHPGQWKAGMLDALGDHFDKWVTQRLMLDQSPEAKSAFFRTSALMKQAQSILLLGGSPSYAITNGLSNMVHRAVSGMYGYMTGKQIDSFMERMGMTPARFDEGVGIGGVVEQGTGKSKVKTSAMDQAVRGKGALTAAKDALGKLSKGMPFSKLSSAFERMEGRQAFSIGMRDAWSQSWRRGVGFREMPAELANAINAMGQDPKRIYAAIEAGMNISEVEAAVYGRQAEVQARSLIHDAAAKMGMSASEAAQMLERTGVLDTLDTLLKGAKTRDQRAAAFRRADQAAQDWIDMRTGEDLSAIAESVKQRVGLEGAAAALDVVQRAHGTFFDACMDHYYRFGEVMSDLQTLGDSAQMDKAVDYAYEVSDREFRRIDARTAANYKGIFQAWGLSGNPNALRVLESVKQAGDAMGGSYRTMRDNWRMWREKWANDPTNPARWDELDAIRAQNDRAFKDGFKAKHDAEVQMGKALGDIYEGMYGPAAGEAARKWYEDVTAFNDYIVGRERAFRAEMEQARRSGTPKELIDQQKQKYYSETKILLIAEAEKINTDGIARLERTIKGAGGSGQGTVDGGPKPVGPVDSESQVAGQRSQVEGQEIASAAPRNDGNAEVAALEQSRAQRKAQEMAEMRGRIDAVWGVAQEYIANGRNYNRATDGYRLLAALKKPEYGGIRDLSGLDDPRLPPEMARQILENRRTIKELAVLQKVEEGKISPEEQAYMDAFNFDDIKEIEFNSALWQTEFDTALRNVDMERAYALMPDEMMNQVSPSGETWSDLLARISDETVKRDADNARMESVAEGAARAELSIAEAENHADAVTWRAQLLEKMAESFKLDEGQARAYGEMNDAVANWYARMTGESVDDFYNRYFGEVENRYKSFDEAAADEGLMQQAFHGSPYKFDKFTLDHMGSGEGVQAYGWGLYFAGDKAVADYYRKTLSSGAAQPPRRFLNGVEFQPGTPEYHAATLAATSGQTLTKLRKEVQGWIDEYINTPGREQEIKNWTRTLEVLNEAKSVYSFKEKPYAGQLYRVELPDENYLLWDKPLKEQALAVRALFDKYGIYPDLFSGTGQDAYRQLSSGLGGDQAASLALKEAGINGIQYLDGSSRGKGEGNYNYVIFDDAAIQIKETYFQKQTPTPSPSPTSVEGGKKPATIDKGMVTFDGMKGTIYAFEAADFSTVVHETGHIYRRVLADVAERTQNPYVLRDLQAIEEWAGVKDGQWDRAAEEKFARGFEKYTAEGKAPTAALKVAFDNFKKWMLDIYRTITGSQIDVKLTDDVRRVFDRMLGGERKADFNPETEWVDVDGTIRPKEVMELTIDQDARKKQAQELLQSDIMQRLKEQAAKARARRNEPLFQRADVPFGEYERASQFHPQSEDIDAGWREKIRPMLGAMEEVAGEQRLVGEQQSAFSGPGEQQSAFSGQLSGEGQAMMRKYMRQVQNDMATAKLATVRFAEKQRDFALLNYSKRYGVDRVTDAVLPYQLYTTRSGFTWVARAIDKPALYSNYARLRMQQDRYERDIPERLRGKIKISAPWMPDWMGDAMYIDPLKNLFFPAQIMSHFERRQQDMNYQYIEAERVLQEWQADGQYTDAELVQAAKTRSGKVWERAFAEAQIRRESESAQPMDFFTSFFGPAWYLSTPLNLAGVKVPGISQGDPNKVSTLPLGNTSRALETVTKGTWAEPVGQLFGLIGKAEDWGREQFKLPTRGEYAEYYTKRQVANMVAEGLISPEDAQVAMIEKQGQIWEQAKERVDMELALRVPLAGVTYAALHDGPQAAMQAAVPSLFGSSLLPAGELEFRGLKGEWNEAWKLADAGDTTAVTRFFDEHPEYEAYLAKGKDDEELLRSFLVGQIWDQYMELGDTNQKQARAELGEAFLESFLNKETRSYETLTVEQLAGWAQSLGGMVPKSNLTPNPSPKGEGSLPLYPEGVTGITDQYFEQRREKFPNYYEEQSGYYALPKSERKTYLLEHPNLKKYWDWKDGWFDAYPEYKDIFNGNAFDRVDTSGWIPGLEDAVREAALMNGRLPSGARAALMNVWMLEGQPMGDFDTWVTGVVMPGMVYGGGGSE